MSRDYSVIVRRIRETIIRTGKLIISFVLYYLPHVYHTHAHEQFLHVTVRFVLIFI